MDPQRAAKDLAVIRQLMERPIRYSTQSGLSGIWAGLTSLIGLALDYRISSTYDQTQAFWMNLAVWAGVLVVAAAGVLVLTRLRERAVGLPAWSGVKSRILRTVLPPFLAGGCLTLVIAGRWYTGEPDNQWGLIPAIWMLFYGLALWQLGELTPIEVRLLAVAFLVMGLVAAVAQAHPYWTLGIAFGGFHIVYGVAVWIRHGG